MDFHKALHFFQLQFSIRKMGQTIEISLQWCWEGSVHQRCAQQRAIIAIIHRVSETTKYDPTMPPWLHPWMECLVIDMKTENSVDFSAYWLSIQALYCNLLTHSDLSPWSCWSLSDARCTSSSDHLHHSDEYLHFQRRYFRELESLVVLIGQRKTKVCFIIRSEYLARMRRIRTRSHWNGWGLEFYSCSGRLLVGFRPPS